MCIRDRVMKDTHRLKEVFRQYDKRGIGSLTLEQFRAIMLDFGVDMIPEEAERFMRRYTRQRDEIPFTDFFQRLLGFPPDYFSAKLKSNANEAPDKAMATRKPYDKLPADTPDEKLTRLFVSRVRSRLYDVNSALVNVLKKGRGDRYFGLKELNDIIVVNGSTPTKRELQELMDHFDLRGDGRIHYHEFVYELLDLPIPREIATTIPNHKGYLRPPLSLRGEELVNRIRAKCVKAAARPGRIEDMFRQFDVDGSGTITYDEVDAMVRDFKLEMKDGDAPSVLLRVFDKNLAGKLSYQEFCDMLLGEKGVYEAAAKDDRPSTAKVKTAISQGLREHMFMNTQAIRDAFAKVNWDLSLIHISEPTRPY
eukprot:TRINITY_DN2145_c0_g1_i2.p1 TRINITY_DN2145_c0_g1~~TRINITY_DN2145_c0_g1_i2.p1  ORF type:complete len:366 (-),score=112.04 TRINITY_DN2145_c0_g1_i2:68-1165(-)